jgi:hypothetical protein
LILGFSSSNTFIAARTPSSSWVAPQPEKETVTASGAGGAVVAAAAGASVAAASAGCSAAGCSGAGVEAPQAVNHDPTAAPADRTRKLRRVSFLSFITTFSFEFKITLKDTLNFGQVNFTIV